MEILLNGEKRAVAPGVTVAFLVEQLRLPGKRMAVEINEEIVPRADYAGRALAEGDRVEIVRAVGGG